MCRADHHAGLAFSEAAGACLVPVVSFRVGLAHFAVQAVGVGRHHNLRHQRCKSLAVVGLRGG